MMRFVLAVAAMLLGAAPAEAQSELETASFIILGELADKTSSGAKYSGDRAEINVGLRPEDTVAVERTSKCNFRVRGQMFFNDFRAPVDYTVDFSNMRDGLRTQSFEQDKKFGYMSSKWFHYQIPGVKICVTKQYPNLALFFHPSEGSCFDFLATRGFTLQKEADRLRAAIGYMRSNFCKGSAF